MFSLGESTTPTSLPQNIPNIHFAKQGSPFYAEPADSLMPAQILSKNVTRSSETPTRNCSLQSFRLVNFRVKPDREHNPGIVMDRK